MNQPLLGSLLPLLWLSLSPRAEGDDYARPGYDLRDQTGPLWQPGLS